MDNEFVKKYIKPVLETLYDLDPLLFQHNLSERCIAFRFAHYLQNKFDELNEYNVFVDCDYNSHIALGEDGEWRRHHGKPLSDRGGTGVTGRFIDLIVHKRTENKDADNWSDLICFELKKWNNETAERTNKDRNNLERLTSDFGYQYGFYVVFGQNKEDLLIEVFAHGASLGRPFNLFQNQIQEYTEGIYI